MPHSEFRVEPCPLTSTLRGDAAAGPADTHALTPFTASQTKDVSVHFHILPFAVCWTAGVPGCCSFARFIVFFHTHRAGNGGEPYGRFLSRERTLEFPADAPPVPLIFVVAA